MYRLLSRLQDHFNQIRRDPLRRYIYLLLWPWFIPVVSYLIFDAALIADARSLVSGLVVVLFLCTIANELDTYALLRIIRRYPALNQSVWRLGWMVGAFGVINALLAELSLRLFDITHFLGYTYRPEINIWVLSFVFISSVVAAALIESAYAFVQWKTNHVDRQNLEQENLRIQLGALKSRINPHFLFNSLNSVSSLIADEPKQAEQFVDELSKVYRYLLQANKNPLVPLDTEVRFIQSYRQLLEARYGQALQCSLNVTPKSVDRLLPPLSLQILIDDIIQHNALTVSKPLTIRMESVTADRIWIRYNRQPRTVLVDRKLPGLDDIIARYQWLGGAAVLVETTDEHGAIGLPLLPTDSISSTISTTQS